MNSAVSKVSQATQERIEMLGEKVGGNLNSMEKKIKHGFMFVLVLTCLIILLDCLFSTPALIKKQEQLLISNSVLSSVMFVSVLMLMLVHNSYLSILRDAQMTAPEKFRIPISLFALKSVQSLTVVFIFLSILEPTFLAMSGQLEKGSVHRKVFVWLVVTAGILMSLYSIMKRGTIKAYLTYAPMEADFV